MNGTVSLVSIQANRVYPREQARDTLHTGRVRIQLLDKDGSPVHSELLNSQLFVCVGWYVLC